MGGQAPPGHPILLFYPARTAKEQNDPSGLTIWGVFQTPEKKRQIIRAEGLTCRRAQRGTIS